VRAAFATLAGIAVHDKKREGAPFIERLALLESGAADGRRFVKKAVSWALRSIGRRNAKLNAQATALARRLAASNVASERRVGKDALRDLTKPTLLTKLAQH